eukprot:361871-Chlamydomonas_euryale.AAC.4
MMCAGMTAMTSAPAGDALLNPEHSAASMPVSTDAAAPNHVGTKTQMSLSDQPSLRWSNVCLIATLVSCIPGKMVVPTGRPSGYQDVWSNHVKNFRRPSLYRYSVAR